MTIQKQTALFFYNLASKPSNNEPSVVEETLKQEETNKLFNYYEQQTMNFQLSA